MNENDPELGRLLARAAEERPVNVAKHLGEVHRREPTPRAPGERRWLAAAVAFVVAGAGVGYGIWSLRDVGSDESTGQPGTSPSAFAPPVDVQPFVPVTYSEDGNAVLPIAFLDGSTAEMVYPKDLGLEREYVQPSGNVTLEEPGGDGFGGAFTVVYSPVDGYTDGLIETSVDARGNTIRLWAPVLARDAERDLALRLGSWVLLIDENDATGAAGATPDRLTPQQSDIFLHNLVGTETANGFLMLDAAPPLRVWGVLETPGHPELFFGDDLTLTAGCMQGVVGDSSFKRNGLLVHVIEDGFDVNRDYLIWCDATEQFTMSAPEGDFANRLIDGLTFRQVSLQSSVRVIRQ